MNLKKYETILPPLSLKVIRVIVALIPGSYLFNFIRVISRILTLPVRFSHLSLITYWPLSRDINAMVLRRMLDYATHNGGRFRIFIAGKKKAERKIKNAYADKNRLILCSAHFPLNRAIHLLLKEAGIPAVTIKAPWFDMTPFGWLWGDGGVPDTIENSESVFFSAWEKLSKGSAMIILLDNLNKKKTGVLLHSEKGQQLYVAPNIFRFAAKTRTPVVFFSSFLSKGQIHIKIKRPETPYPETKAEIMPYMDDFIGFIKEEMKRHQGFDQL